MATSTETVMTLPCLVLVIISALTSCTCASADSYEHGLVKFGTLKELMLQDYNLTSPQFMQPDIMNPGEYLLADEDRLIRIHTDHTVSILAEKEGDFIRDFIQVGTDSILINYYKVSCFKKYNRTSQLITTIPEMCGELAAYSSTDEHGFDMNSRLSAISQSLFLPEENILYHLAGRGSTKSSIILMQNITSGIISLVEKKVSFGSSNQMNKRLFAGRVQDSIPTFMILDSKHENIYILYQNGLSKVSRTTWEENAIIAPPYNNRRIAINGPLSAANLIDSIRMDWLIEDQVLVVAEHFFSLTPGQNRELRIINLVDGYVSSLCQNKLGCKGECVPSTVLRNSTTCQLKGRWSVTVVNGVMYIISDDILSNNTALLEMQIYPLQCQVPNILNGSFEPMKDNYKHLDTLLQVCETGYALPPSNYLLTCVRSQNDNGTIIGIWYPQPLPCEKLNITGIQPDKGQKKGGTLVSLLGFVPRRLILQVDNSGVSINEFSFTIPPASASTNENLDPVQVIVTVLNESDGSEYKKFVFTYKYLPNPKLVDGYKTRQDSFLRGGSNIKFMLHNAASAYNYTFHFSDFVQIGKIPEQNCIARINIVECDLPDFEKYYNESFNIETNQARRKATETDLFGHGSFSLRADGELVDGVENLAFQVHPRNPDIYNFTEPRQVHEIGGKKHISLYGENLNLGALEEDYNITLHVEAQIDFPAQSFHCPITHLTDSEVMCQPEEGNGLKQYLTAVNADVWVRIGRHLIYKPGDITIILPRTTVNNDSGYLPEEAVIAIGVVGSILLIVLVVVVIWLCYYKKQREQGENKELRALHDRMIDKYKEDIKDYLIDPELLSFDPASKLLGKGQFGNVYKAQLLVDDVIKTVAVKTLKEPGDVGIHISELEDFLDEACFLKGYKHRNVLGTVGIVWKRGDRPIMVLPYMSRGSLKSLVQNPTTALYCGDLIHFAMQVACGMQYLSENGIVHRDLAARNCLVSEAYIVRISDFGMSRAVDESHYYREGMIQRPKPVRWMALESLTDCKYNTKTDVWSFGVLLWELFTRGELPYKDISNNEIREFLLSGKRLEKTGDMDDMMYEAMLTCWNKDSQKRPIFEELYTFFKDCLSRSRMNDPSAASSEYSYVQDCTSHIEDGYISLYSDLDIDLYVPDKLKKEKTTHRCNNEYVDLEDQRRLSSATTQEDSRSLSDHNMDDV